MPCHAKLARLSKGRTHLTTVSLSKVLNKLSLDHPRRDPAFAFNSTVTDVGTEPATSLPNHKINFQIFQCPKPSFSFMDLQRNLTISVKISSDRPYRPSALVSLNPVHICCDGNVFDNPLCAGFQGGFDSVSNR